MEGALAGMRVIDLSQGVSGPYCTKMLADFGAEVIKVEPPDGDVARVAGPFPGDTPHPEKSALFLHLNTNKRSITLDLHCEAGAEALRRLVASADSVVENFPPGTLDQLGLSYDRLAELNPRLVLTSLTPYGSAGMYRDYQATHLINCATSGWMFMCGDLERAPLQCGGIISEYASGLYGASGTLAAYFASKTAGTGEHVDISTQEAVQILTIFGVHHYADTGMVRDRSTAMSWSAEMLECKDGIVACHLTGAGAWDRLCEWIGRPDLIGDPAATDGQRRMSLLRPILSEFLRELTREEVFREARARHLSFCLVPTISELLEFEQHRVRNFFVDVEHPAVGRLTHPGAPFKMSATPAGSLRPAPLLGQDNRSLLCEELGYRDEELPALTGSGEGLRGSRSAPLRRSSPMQPAPRAAASLPLEGIRVLDATWVMAGPTATSLLADLGAEVIKVRNPASDRPDGFKPINRNKYGITLNLKDPRGADIFRRLAAISDIVAENYTASVMSKLGLDYEALTRVRPDLIMISIPGYGATGPWKDHPSYAFPTEEMSGIAQLTGYPGGPPMIAGSGSGDPLAGLHGGVALLMALNHRRRTGKGQHIDLSQMEACTNLVGEAILDYGMNGRIPQRRGNRHPTMAPHGVYRCRGEDKWVAIAIGYDDEWQRLVQVIGSPAWANDQKFATTSGRLEHQDEIDAGIELWTRERRPYAVMHRCQEAGVAAGAVLGPVDLLVDPHLRERGFFEWVEQANDGGHWFPRQPIRLAHADVRVRMPPPTPGEHNAEILQRLLGITQSGLAELEAAEIISKAPLGAGS